MYACVESSVGVKIFSYIITSDGPRVLPNDLAKPGCHKSQIVGDVYCKCKVIQADAFKLDASYLETRQLPRRSRRT